jgi:toxin ParE1/3/4
MAFDIVLSPAAVEDLDELAHDYRILNSRTPVGYFEAILETLGQLPDFPNRGRLVPEFLSEGERRYRELLVEQFRAIYRMEGEHIMVIRIIDGRRLVSMAMVDGEE